MGTKDAAGPGYGPKRLGDVDFLKEVACQNERKNWVASRIGLPTIGTSMVNKHGIEWVVQNHAAVPTADTLQRWRARDIQPTNDLYPVVAPKNLSPKLLEFIAAVDRCTTKTFAVLDTMPGRRKDGHVPGGNSIDTLTHPETNLLFLDAARVSETVIAHEIGHAWVQYVDECEDLRTLEDASYPQRMKQVSFVQSFVLDLKVNDLIARKGFDVSSIRDDQRASIQQLSEALRGGYRPKHPREEVFMGLLVADEFIQRDRRETHDLARMDDSLETIRGALGPLASLADRMAEAVRKHGYGSRDAIVACIDECLLMSFEHCNDRFDLESELVVVNPEEPNLDKFPKWLPQLPPGSKCMVGKYMARNDISSQWAYKLEPSITGRAMVEFRSPESDRQSQILLNDLIGPPTRYCHLSEVEAMNLSMKIRNRTGSYQIYGGPPHNPREEFLNLTRPTLPQVSQVPGLHGFDQERRASLRLSDRSSPSLFRPYMAGLGRFLTAARMAEQLGGESPLRVRFRQPGHLYRSFRAHSRMQERL